MMLQYKLVYIIFAIGTVSVYSLLSYATTYAVTQPHACDCCNQSYNIINTINTNTNVSQASNTINNINNTIYNTINNTVNNAANNTLNSTNYTSNNNNTDNTATPPTNPSAILPALPPGDTLEQLQRHPPSQNTTGLIVMGMHRSGTSMLTGAISLCLGIPTSTPEMNYTMMKAGPENQKGFFERHDIFNLNVFLLKEMRLPAEGYSPTAVVKCTDTIEETSHSAYIRKPCIKALIEELTQYDTWIVKDPRMVQTYGYYNKYVNHPVFIIPIRHPVEVVRSLVARTPRSSANTMLRVWENYMYNSLRYSIGMKRIFLFHSDFITSVNTSLSYVYSTLKEMGVNVPSRSQEYIDQCSAQWVDSKLVHQKHAELNLSLPLKIGRETIDPVTFSKYITLYENLKSGAALNWTLNDLPPSFRTHPYVCVPPKKP